MKKLLPFASAKAKTTFAEKQPEQMTRYQDIYPSDPLLRSKDVVRPRASELINLEFFEADAADMPRDRFVQHHILINLKSRPMQVENWRDGMHREFTFSRCELAITRAGMESGWRWHETSKVIVITIDPEQLQRFAEHELGQILTKRQLADVPQVYDADLTAAAEMLLDALETRNSGSEVMYESLARVFTVKLLQRYGEEAAPEANFSKSFTAKHYKRVLDHVAKHYGGSVAIADMARAAGLSEAHFSRQFKKTIGDTPHHFVMRYRVERAIDLVADQTRELSEIAITCGFSDQAHLSRLFKQYTGSTPRQYRAAS